MSLQNPLVRSGGGKADYSIELQDGEILGAKQDYMQGTVQQIRSAVEPNRKCKVGDINPEYVINY